MTFRIGRIELRAFRNYCGGFAHLVHYSGRMHTWHVGPVAIGYRIWSGGTK